MTGAEMVIEALADQGVEHLFGYPGGAVLPIYDALFQQSNRLQHILVRHEQGAVHAAEGYARSTGKVGCVLVTSGPGATNAVTGLTDALCDSIPIVCITGQVPTHLIGNDAFQECDTVGITRPCTKYNYLVKNIADLPRVLHEAFHIAKSGRPGPVVVDIPKDIQFAKGIYAKPKEIAHKGYKPQAQGRPRPHQGRGRPDARTPSGRCSTPAAASSIPVRRRASCCASWSSSPAFPITSTLMGLGAFPASDPQWLGMLGMHGTWEANWAMHDCDLMICIGARFDDRITGRLDAFSPGSKKIHVDIDPSSINKNVKVDLPIIGDCAHVLEDMVRLWRARLACPTRRRSPTGGSRSKVARAQVARLQELEGHHQAAIRDPAAVRADQGPRHLHHHRSGPAPDVGGAVLPLRGAEPLDDLGRARHHGLRPAGVGRRAARASELAGHRHRRRGLGADDHAGNVDGGAVPAADQDLHHQQPVHGHGAAVAGAAARRALCRELHPFAAGFREARRGLSRGRHPLREAGRARRARSRR